jgi:outer membrane protein TolC
LKYIVVILLSACFFLNAYELPDYQVILDAIAREKNKMIDIEVSQDDDIYVTESVEIESLPDAIIVEEDEVILPNDIELVDITPSEVYDDAVIVTKYISDETLQGETLDKINIDFWQLLDLTMEKSASLLLKKHDIKATKANLSILKNEYYPHLSMNYTNEYYHGFSRSGNSANIGGSVYPDTSEYRNDLNLNFDYELYRFGATDLKMDMISDDIEIINSELGLEKEKISKELLQHYVNVLKAQESISFKEKIRDLKQIILNNYQRLFEVGKLSKVDITAKNVELITLVQSIAEDRLTLYESIKNIEILSNVVLVVDSTNFCMLKPKRIKPVIFEQSQTSKNIKLQIEKKLKEIELIKKDYYPTLLANGEYRLYGGDDNNVFDAINELERNNWRLGLILKWKIFDGFKSDKSIAKAKLEVEKLIEHYRLAKINYESQEKKRELYNTSIDRVLRENSRLVDQIGVQQEMLSKLEKIGKASSIQIDVLKVNSLRQELAFRLNVIDKMYKIVLGELNI